MNRHGLPTQILPIALRAARTLIACSILGALVISCMVAGSASAIEPPAAPTNLSATLFMGAGPEVYLLWLDNADDELGAYIERAAVTGGPLEFVRIAQTVRPVTIGSYVDTAISEGMTYAYRVAAYGFGGVSGYSNVETITIGQEPPGAPSGLRVLNVSRTSVRIRWQDNSADQEGFYIERGTEGSGFRRVAQVASDVTDYTDRLGARCSRVSYRVQAFSDAGVSEYSETIHVNLHN